MGQIGITKKDVAWGYIAQFFSIASGLITLPIILRLLSTEEIAMNYLMLTIGSLVALFDFGFAPQFGRNISYIFSGAQELKKEGIVTNDIGILNYELLAAMISVAKMVYRVLAIIVLLVMLSLGSLYIGKVTNGFTNIDHALEIWIIYSISTFFNIYYTYYNSLLTGKGLIMEAKKAMLASRIASVLLVCIFLFAGWGLIGVSLANLIAPFVGRYVSHYYFFTKDLLNNLRKCTVSKEEKSELFKIIWYNARKLGLVFVGSYAVNKFSMFLVGLYLPLDSVASYGLMIQLMNVITMISVTFFSISGPKFAALRVENRKLELIRSFAFTMNIYYILFIFGCLGLVFLAPLALNLIGSNTSLPSWNILLVYSIIVLLENNHSNFSTFIVTENKIPFVQSSLLAGTAICVSSFLSLKYTDWGVWGIILIQGFFQLVYANWKWPYVVCRDFKMSFCAFLKLGANQSLYRLHHIRWRR